MRRFRVVVNGLAYEVEVEDLGAAEVRVQPAPSREERTLVEPSPAVPERPQAAQPEARGDVLDVVAPLPGTVLAVKATPHMAVEEGEVLVVLEAMKMENEIMAPRRGVVREVRVREGQSVNVGDVMVRLEPSGRGDGT